MSSFSKGVVKFRIPILIISILLLIPSFISFAATKVNYDILYYLPDSIDSMKGQDILLNDFGKGAYAMFVCENMEDKYVKQLSEEIKDVDHVASVLGYSEIADSIPPEMLPDKVKDVFYSKDGEAKMMFIFFDTGTSSNETMDAIKEIRSIAGKDCFLSSMSAVVTDTKDLVDSQIFWYVLIAVVLCAIVLALTMDSFIIPILFLLDIGMAIIYNLGTNFIQGEISYITMALVAVLQLGVTMDYSIFLYQSYKEQKMAYADHKQAMAKAISMTIESVTGSSLTTIAGFVALCFMSFTLGLDLGIVMAKGVLFGVICCVTILPSMIIIFDAPIAKFSHKPLNIKPDNISKKITKHSWVLFIIMLVLWIPAVIGNNNVKVYYKLDTSLPAYLGSTQANEELKEHFDMNSMSMILVDADLSSKETKAMTQEIENVDGITFALGLDSVVGSQFPDELIPEKIKDILQTDDWKLMLVASKYEVATDEVGDQCSKINNIIKKYDPNGMLIGEAAGTEDLITITDHDFAVVSLVSIGAIFVIILIVLRSALLPVLLVAVIELAIYLNMGMAFYTGTTLPFIASVCIGTIQLGATVDYAILMTTRYKRERMGGADKHDAVTTALSTSLQSIFTSALGFFAATIGVAIYSDVDMLSSLCLLMGRGAIISFIVVILFLPSVLMTFDKAICATTVGMRKLIHHKGGLKNVED